MDPNGLFNPPIGNDLPSQGGITGNMYGDMYGDIPDLTPVSSDDPSGGTLPSSHPMMGGMLNQAPDINTPRTLGDIPLPDESPDDFIARRMSELYTPEHSASDAYNAMLAKYPVHPKHGFLSKLGASLYGMGHGVKGAEDFLDSGYNRQVQDWKNQIGPMGTSANLERYMNSNERQYANQEVQRELQERDIKRKETADQNKADYQKASIAERKARTAFMYYKVQHPNAIFQTDNDGYVYALDPQTHQADYVQDEDGDLVQNSKLPEAMRIAQQHQNKMAEIDAQGQNRIEAIDETGAQTRQTRRETPTGTGGINKPPSAREIDQQRKNRAKEVVSADPNNAKWIRTDPTTGGIMIVPPSNGIFGGEATPEQLAHAKYLRDYIMNGVGASPNGSSQPNSTLPPPEHRKIGMKNPNNPNAIWTYGPDGTLGWWGPKAGGKQ